MYTQPSVLLRATFSMFHGRFSMRLDAVNVGAMDFFFEKSLRWCVTLGRRTLYITICIDSI